MLTSKHGDNAQSLTLAKALSLPFLCRTLHFRAQYEQQKPKVRATIRHVDRVRSDALKPPWPELIIVTGRRPSMVALWIKEQSGGRTKIALIGKPKACFDQFDLVIAAAHYKLPEGRSNVMRIGLPLIGVAAERLELAGQAWSQKLESLERPLTALCFGGSTGARPLDPVSVKEIMLASQRAAPEGTLYVLTSRRTPPFVLGEIRNLLPGNGRFYGWKDQDDDNPYLGLLALADQFIVTGDSISMLVEIARLGRPLALAALPPERGLTGLAKRLVSRLGSGPSRDFELLHRYLYDHGWAVPLGQDFASPASPPPDYSAMAAQRVRCLLGAQ